MRLSRVVVLCALAGAVASSHAALAADRVVQAGYHYHYFKERRPLTLDVSRVAVQAADAAALAKALAAAGIDPATVAPHPIKDWHLVPIPGQTSAARAEALVAALAAQPGVNFAAPVFFDDLGGPMWPTADLLVGFDAATPAAVRDGVLKAANAGAVTDRDYLPGTDRVASASRSGLDVLAAANALALDPATLYAEPDMIFTGRGTVVPNDTFFGSLWGIHNTGQSGGVADQDMDGPEAWDITTGSNAIVAVVLDNGTELGHPDLNLAPGNDFTSDASVTGAPVNPCDNHGTAVAGCISARINNALGVAGIAPACRTASTRCFISNQPCDGGWNAQGSWTVDALNWAQGTGARVTNNSNIYGFSSAAIATAYSTTWTAGIVHFASAGNGGFGSLAYPSSIPVVNSVAALSRTGARASFSQWGPGLDFSAPGQAIDTTDRLGGAGYSGTDYATVDGTSFASPYAAGVACLILSRNPALTAAQVEAVMQASCVNLGPAGYDTDFGWGFVNARAALNALGPTNDACASAINVSAGGDFTGTLLGAANETTFAGICGSSSTNPDVWYVYTAPACGGRLTVSTCGTHDAPGADGGMDTVLSLHATCGGAALDCNDDGAGDPCAGADNGNERDSFLTRTLAGGETVRIRVSKFSTVGAGTFQLHVSFTIPNDECAGAATVGNGVTSYCSTTATTSAPVLINCGGSAGTFPFYRDLWFRYTPTHSGRFTVRNCGQANWDTVLAAYASCPAAPGTQIACSDDACDSRRSSITVQGAAGVPVLIRAGSFSDTGGSGAFTILCSADFTADGVVEVGDIFAFLSAWFNGNPAAEYDGVAGLGVGDIFAFLSAWFAGC